MLIRGEPERIVGYVRVSTEEQAENRISIDSQIRLIEDDAGAKGQAVAAMFVEPGVSGRDDTRPEFNRMLAFVENPANRVAEVKVWSQSRLARSTETIIPTFARLRRAKVRLVSLTQSIADDPTGHLMRVVIAGFDEHFAAEAAKHTRRTMRANAAEGFFNGGPVPFGYTSVTVEVRGTKQKKKLQIVPEEAEVVRRIFDLASVGDGNGPLGARGISEWLNARGYSLRGAKFNNSNLGGILARDHYAGRYFDKAIDEHGRPGPESDWIAVPCPEIVNLAQMQAVAALRARRAPRVTAPRIVSGPTLLTAVARCGVCGAGLTIATGKSGQYRYYKCNARVNGGATRCSNPPVPAAQLDDTVIDVLRRRLFDPDRLCALLATMLEISSEADERRRNDLAQARSARTQSETRLRNLYELVADGHASPKDATFADMVADTKTRLASLSASIELIEAQLRHGAKRITEEHVRRFAALMNDRLADPSSEVCRGFVRLYVAQVRVTADEIQISGSTDTLGRLTARMATEPNSVPSFDREWCRLQDSNL